AFSEQTPRGCQDIFTRWMDDDCYCPVGLFWTSEVLNVEVLTREFTRLWSGKAHQTQQHSWCTVKGQNEWGVLYPAYCWAAGLGFGGIVLWSAIRLQHGYRARGHDQPLQVAIHALCLAAAVVRVVYVASEAILVDTAPGASSVEKLAGVLYTAFFSLSAAAFLCTCQHWLRLFDSMDLSQDGEALVESPWYRNPLLLVCLLFLSLEGLHDTLYMQGGHPALNGMYFFWLSLISVLAALLGVRIAWRLYTRLRLWLSADERNMVFRRTIMSSALVSVCSVCMLILSVLQALVGRFYPWPCLVCWILGRSLEFVYLAVVLRAVGPAHTAHPSVTSSNSLHGLQEASFAESVSSCGSPGREVQHGGRQSLWITTRGLSGGQRSAD
ncbi:unnamed protein product, partial [Durusdinium trenchii]